MESIDFNTDGVPDGIIDLFVETGITPQPGDIWESTGDESAEVALEASTGILRVWKLINASDDYEFTLRNTSCSPSVRATVQFILGPYAGKPVTTGFYAVCDINFECDIEIEIDLDLFETLETKEEEAPPHLNGTWRYTGALPSSQYVLENSEFGATIPYTPGDGSPVDSQDFTFTYTIAGQGSCTTKSTDIQITLIRRAFAGYASERNICITDVNVWDQIINLNDDRYLEQEDEDGTWSFTESSGLETPITNQINLKDYIDAYLSSPEYVPGFGCKDFVFNHTVRSRAPVCEDSRASVVFRVFEELKEFEQVDGPEEICPATYPGTELDLYDLLTFSPGFEYQNGTSDTELVRWTFESGPSDLDLFENLNELEMVESHRGPISIAGASPGRYEFRYTVTTDTTCTAFKPQILYEGSFCAPDIRSFNPCGSISAPVVIEIVDFDYAGENTNINLCSADVTDTVSLRSLLQDNGSVIIEGTWINEDTGLEVDDQFLFPDTITDPISFSFTHRTGDPLLCEDTARLEVTIFNPPNAGEDAIVQVCTNDLTINLFDQLEGNPDDSGSWFGPFGYVSTDNVGRFDPSDDTLPILGPGEYVYSVPGNDGCAMADQATLTIRFVDPIAVGNDINATFCKQDGGINLFQLLDRNTARTGRFVDPLGLEVLDQEGVVSFETLTNGIYTFQYIIDNNQPCDISSLDVNIQIVDLPIPNVPDQEFCILDAVRLDAIEVDVLNYNWYDTLESETPVVDNPLLVDNQIYYIASVDVDNCESERLQVSINILNTGERSATGEFCTLDFQDGVSPNGDNQNDTFDLLIEDVYNIPEAFPDFELQIFNRYGSLVYEGNSDTEEFRGESNTSVRLGDDLPSGTYFYIFVPNFENNLPIQGSFYLSR